MACALGHDRCKADDEIAVGDIIVLLGTPHLVDSIEPYDGPIDAITKVARSRDGWGISLVLGLCLEVA